MNTRASIALSVTAALLCSTSLVLRADEAKPGNFVLKPFSHSFQRMAELQGLWTGKKMDMQTGKKVHIQVEYRLTSGNSALTELLFKDSPEEMLSVYHDDGQGITMTHYCGLGNQPRMHARGIQDNKIGFQFKDGGNMASPDEMHMHSLTITFLDSDRIQHEWQLYRDGKKDHAEKFILTRTR